MSLTRFALYEGRSLAHPRTHSLPVGANWQRSSGKAHRLRPYVRVGSLQQFLIRKFNVIAAGGRRSCAEAMMHKHGIGR